MTATPIDGFEFRKALGSFTTGVTVVTTRNADGQDVGLTANSFSSVSLDPPLVLWSLGKNALSMPAFQSADYFAVHILAESQQELSNTFATRGLDKFSNLSLDRGPAEIPLITNCAARFICKATYQYDGGDHTIFVGEVIEFSHFEQRPLLFHGGQYGQLLKEYKEHSQPRSNEFADQSLGYLLRYCSHMLLRKLKPELIKSNLSISQYYFLALLAKLGHCEFSFATDVAMQGENTPTDKEIDDLFERGYISITENRVGLSAKGSKTHMQLVAFYTAEESSALNSIDYKLRQSLHIALTNIAETLSVP
ncbi:flavin reductase family protein [Zhongshania aquimaris]|uniref:Flavin reductase family protein n=1 Tax=Zhongshania aquimaris TaxID=2857107 RepID=A0ABS6VWI6_9GAMM|nr:flavin reductase family protein [Zhongshania aquimaris]MBW2942726.1 flavin reductase family protein [Zhongshania aquimaris]